MKELPLWKNCCWTLAIGASLQSSGSLPRHKTSVPFQRLMRILVLLESTPGKFRDHPCLVVGFLRARLGSTGFRRRFRSRFRRRSGRHWCSKVRFNRVPEKVPVKVWEALGKSQVRFNRVRRFRWRSGRLFAGTGQVQQGSGESSGEGLGGFGAARSGSTGFRRRFPEKVWRL